MLQTTNLASMESDVKKCAGAANVERICCAAITIKGMNMVGLGGSQAFELGLRRLQAIPDDKTRPPFENQLYFNR